MDSTPRDAAFCAHAIHDDALLEIPDAHDDPRFADNPLVTGFPGVRSYAGASLRMPDGTRIGTLCVIDRQPRHLDDAARDVLTCLADAAVRALQPVADPSPAAGSMGHATANGLPQLRINGRRPRLLVAEDEPVNRKVIARLLAKLGCDATLVNDGQHALEAVVQQPFDCVLPRPWACLTATATQLAPDSTAKHLTSIEVSTPEIPHGLGPHCAQHIPAMDCGRTG